MKLKDYRSMKPDIVYHFDNLELVFADGVLYSHYPQHEDMWYEFPENDKFFDKWKDREIVEGHFSK